MPNCENCHHNLDRDICSVFESSDIASLHRVKWTALSFMHSEKRLSYKNKCDNGCFTQLSHNKNNYILINLFKRLAGANCKRAKM